MFRVRAPVAAAALRPHCAPLPVTLQRLVARHCSNFSVTSDVKAVSVAAGPSASAADATVIALRKSLSRVVSHGYSDRLCARPIAAAPALYAPVRPTALNSAALMRRALRSACAARAFHSVGGPLRMAAASAGGGGNSDNKLKEGDRNKIALTFQGITKKAGHNVIISNVNASFYQGAKIGVLGVNGSGKTSLLRIIAGMRSMSSARRVLAALNTAPSQTFMHGTAPLRTLTRAQHPTCQGRAL
jgi:ABC-type multidrug transport system fused ATPase/permease subunit